MTYDWSDLFDSILFDLASNNHERRFRKRCTEFRHRAKHQMKIRRNQDEN